MPTEKAAGGFAITMKRQRLMTSCSVAARLILASLLLLVACSPEVGSDAWCEKMKETPKGDWSTNDAAAFAKQCVFK